MNSIFRTAVSILCLGWIGNCLAWEPLYESIVVDDVVYSGLSGNVKIKQHFVDGVLQSSRTTFETASGETVYFERIEINKTMYIHTPDHYLRLKNVSGRKFELKNMNTGSKKNYWAPTGGWQDTAAASSVFDLESGSGWENDLINLLAEYETHLVSGNFSNQHPLGKYAVSDYATEHTDECGIQEQLDCKEAKTIRLVVNIGGAIVCVGAFATGAPAVVIGGACIAWFGSSWSVDHSMRQTCRACQDYQSPDNPNPPSIEPPEAGDQACFGTNCSNHGGLQSGGMLTCDQWVRTVVTAGGQTFYDYYCAGYQLSP